MNVFKKINLAQKLPIVMIGLTALAICVSGFISHTHASKALLVEAEKQLSTIAEARQIELQSLLDGIDMGRDGAEGMRALRANGAKTLGQSKETCVVFGMPKVAGQLGAIERWVDIDNFGDEMLTLAEVPVRAVAL